MEAPRSRVARAAGVIAGLLLAALLVSPPTVEAQRRTRPPVAAPVGPPAPPIKPAPQPAEPAKPGEQPETIQADISARSVAITSSFTGVEIVVFGAVDNSRQSSAEAGLYDVIIILEGAPSRLVARRKSNVAGVWLNTQSVTFESVPSYYAILSTRPLDEVADPLMLREYDIGFEQVRMPPVQGWETGITTADLEDFKAAVIRLKKREGLYVEKESGVVFIGRSLFRASLDLPPNVPVGPLVARVYLFREGRMLSNYATRVNLERTGLERYLHDFAFQRPVLYGLATVALAIGAGLLASTVFQRGGH